MGTKITLIGHLTIPEVITLLRKRNGYTITELAKRAGLSRNYIGGIENGNVIPENIPLSTLQKIFEAMGVILDVGIAEKPDA